jgi:hypothetical protein
VVLEQKLFCFLRPENRRSCPEALEDLIGLAKLTRQCFCSHCWLTTQELSQSEKKETSQQKGPQKRPGFWRTVQYFKGSQRKINISATRQRNCPPQGEGTFAYFCCRAKVWRFAVRVLPVLPLLFKTQKSNRLTICYAETTEKYINT